MTPRSIPIAVLGPCILMLAACATTAPLPSTPEGAASHRVAPSTGTRRYTLAMGQVASGGVPVERVMPAYPRARLAACPASVEVPALLVVDRGGRVSEVRVAGETGAGAARRPFIAAVRAAALQWSFVPLQRTRWAADANGNSHVVDSEVLPFSRSYRFHFTCHQGRPQVSAGAATPASAG
jgi:hypothetical protein